MAGILTITFTWRGRWNEFEKSLTFTIDEHNESTFTECRQRAIACGYPGHRGGFWNYLTDDILRMMGRPTRQGTAGGCS